MIWHALCNNFSDAFRLHGAADIVSVCTSLQCLHPQFQHRPGSITLTCTALPSGMGRHLPLADLLRAVPLLGCQSSCQISLTEYTKGLPPGLLTWSWVAAGHSGYQGMGGLPRSPVLWGNGHAGWLLNGSCKPHSMPA